MSSLSMEGFFAADSTCLESRVPNYLRTPSRELAARLEPDAADHVNCRRKRVSTSFVGAHGASFFPFSLEGDLTEKSWD